MPDSSTFHRWSSGPGAPPNGSPRRHLDRLSKRLTKILSEARMLVDTLGSDWPVISATRQCGLRRLLLTIVLGLRVIRKYPNYLRLADYPWYEGRAFVGAFHLGTDCDIRSTMENIAASRSTSLAWKLALLLPLAAEVVLQVISRTQTDLRAEVKLSTIGNVFLTVSMIAQSFYLMRTSARWGIVLLIFSSVVLGFGMHVLLRSL